MNFLIDMNLSPKWVEVLRQHGWGAIHWSEVGDPRSTDRSIMQWAQANGYIVFTHDLDFGTLLAATQGEGPSVIQVRTQDVTITHLERVVVNVLHEHAQALETGALVVIDESRSRVRYLPIGR